MGEIQKSLTSEFLEAGIGVAEQVRSVRIERGCSKLIPITTVVGDIGALLTTLIGGICPFIFYRRKGLAADR